MLMNNQDQKYSALCTEIREKYRAAGVVLMILGGDEGSGFLIQADDNAQAQIPEFLELAANKMRQTRMKRGH